MNSEVQQAAATHGEEGIPEERVLNLKQDDPAYIMCSICHGLVWDPVLCKNCENPFCRKCIKRWLDIMPDSCPYNCPYEEKALGRLLINILGQIKIMCKYIKFGCSEVVKYESLKAHQLNCHFQSKDCHACKQSFHVDTYADHDKTCDEIYIFCSTCNYCCKRKEMKAIHNETFCLTQVLFNENKKLREEFKEYRDRTETKIAELVRDNKCLGKNLEALGKKTKLEIQALSKNKICHTNENNKLREEFKKYQDKSETKIAELSRCNKRLEKDLEGQITDLNQKISKFVSHTGEINTYDRENDRYINLDDSNRFTAITFSSAYEKS